jgi:hypothetical protein
MKQPRKQAPPDLCEIFHEMTRSQSRGFGGDGSAGYQILCISFYIVVSIEVSLAKVAMKILGDVGRSAV